MNAESTDRKKRTSIIVGLVLMVLGAVGSLFSTTIKRGKVRTLVFIHSIAACAGGLYLFVGGVTQIALGQLDDRGQVTNQSAFTSPEDFKAKLAKYRSSKQERGNDVRRLNYRCEDGSEEFTIYFTKMGPINVPGSEVRCKDGSKLIVYSEK